MNKKYIPIGGIILILIVIGIIWYVKASRTKYPHYAVRMNTILAKQTAITLNANGFTPNKLTIKKGTAVRWINKSGKQQTVNSDNYPTNQLHRELNLGDFSNGASVMHIFGTVGTYGYHNQFHPDQKGTIIVVQ